MVPQSTIVSDGVVLQELRIIDEVVIPELGVVEVVRPPISHGLCHQKCEARLLEIECRRCGNCQVSLNGQVQLWWSDNFNNLIL